MDVNGVIPSTLQPMTPAMREVLKQLWQYGPTWDGNIASKEARKALVDCGWAIHANGHAFLTAEGVALAVGLFGAKDR